MRRRGSKVAGTRRAIYARAAWLAGAGLAWVLMLTAWHRASAPMGVAGWGRPEKSVSAGALRPRDSDPRANPWQVAPAPRGAPKFTVESLRREDLLDALAWLDGEHSADATFLFEAYSAVLEPAVSRGEFRLVCGLLETTPRADVRALLLAALADVWARRAPAEAAGWMVSGSSAPDRARLLGDLMIGWAARDPAAAVAYAETLPPGDLRQAALASAMLQWRTRDLAAASEWLAERTAHSDFDGAVAALAADPTLIGVDPIAAMSWAGGIATDEVRLNAMADIARVWAVNDAAAAWNYLQTTPRLTRAQRDRVTELITAQSDGGSS